jgi:ubiquinone/menaquinone biosynthesis C-methylase UbiE
MASEPIQPTTIQNLHDSFHKSQAFLAGCQLDVFTALHETPLTADELAERLGCDPRRLSRLLYYLVPTGLLTVSNGRFANTPEADRFLVRGQPGSLIGGTALTTAIWTSEARTAESVRAGRAVANHDYSVLPPEELLDIFRSLDLGARAKGEWLASTFDFTRCHRLVDVGGGSGGLAAALTKRLPNVQATVADLPSVIPVTRQFLAETGAAERVETIAVNLRAEPLPGTYDAAALSHFTQLFDDDEAGTVLDRVGAALNPGGTIYIMGFLLDDTRHAPESALWFNFAAISFYQRGAAHTETEYRTWLKDAGFTDIEVRWGQPIGDVIVARKRG